LPPLVFTILPYNSENTEAVVFTAARTAIIESTRTICHIGLEFTVMIGYKITQNNGATGITSPLPLIIPPSKKLCKKWAMVNLGNYTNCYVFNALFPQVILIHFESYLHI
jgi:hypothetical protein